MDLTIHVHVHLVHVEPPLLIQHDLNCVHTRYYSVYVHNVESDHLCMDPLKWHTSPSA